MIKEREEDGVKVSLVTVTPEGEEKIGKKAGNYLTIEAHGIREEDTELQQRVEKSICE